jgi:Fe-S-cluster-containing hydrogenase component 2
MPEKIRIKVNRHVCSGCLSCMTTCSMVNEAYASLSAARVQVELSPFEGTHTIRICRQCAKAACIEACSQGAISRTPEGYLVIDYDLCNACQDCIAACPFEAMFWNPISEQVILCELCQGDPQCVAACPTGSLTLQTVPARKSSRTAVSQDTGENNE